MGAPEGVLKDCDLRLSGRGIVGGAKKTPKRRLKSE
jgi:hypothetical protein